MHILFAARADDWPVYRQTLAASLQRAGVKAELINLADTPDHDPALIDYIVYAPSSNLHDFTPYTRLKAVLSLWAGVETFQNNPTLTVPLTRMVDPGLSEGMADWVCGHVLRYHLGLDRDILTQDGVWRRAVPPPLARDRRVALLGLGELGRFCALRLRGLGFAVDGWSRSLKSIPQIGCYAGRAGLEAVLSN
ncbi:MAG: glyoxylate/hydroxypyruvate reductase A, partial [Alphaproteobacteria bacterium]|nr:glyoxylate/hydroxypyruvate reductase A [Alphaproteobacteria bacterium]